MTYPTHILGGVASVIVLALVPGANLPAALLPAVAGSLLPDLDSRHSHIQAQSAAMKEAGYALRTLLGHRGPLHTLLTAGIVWFAAWYATHAYAGWEPAAGLLLGYLSHLALDMLTVRGLRVLWPWKRETYWIAPQGMRIVTGSPAETAYGAAFCAMAALVLLVCYGRITDGLQVSGNHMTAEQAAVEGRTSNGDDYSWEQQQIITGE